MNQRLSSNGRWEKKGHLGFRKGERGARTGENPTQRRHDQQGQRTQAFGHLLIFRRSQHGRPAVAKGAKDIGVKIKSAHDGARQVLGLLQTADARDQPILQRVPQIIKKRPHHGVLLVSAVARKKISSRLASPDCSENLWRTSPRVPSMILRPFFKIKTCEQTSTSKCSKCELIKMAAPALLRFRIESFMRR